MVEECLCELIVLLVEWIEVIGDGLVCFLESEKVV